MVSYSLYNIIKKNYDTLAGKSMSVVGVLVSIDILTRFYTGQTIIENMGMNFSYVFDKGLSKAEAWTFGIYYIHSAFKCINDFIGDD